MEGRDPFPDESRESILRSISGGEKGLRFSGAWKLGVQTPGEVAEFALT